MSETTDLIFKLEYARNAAGKIDPTEGSILTMCAVHPEVRKPHHDDGEPEATRLTGRQTAMLLTALDIVVRCG